MSTRNAFYVRLLLLIGFRKVIRLGEHSSNTTEDCDEEICSLPVQDISVDKLLMHPEYDNNKVKNDISLIRLTKEAEYNGK